MSAKAQDLFNFFQKHGGVARFSAVLKAGFHPDSLVALEKQGRVEKIGCGLYRLTEYTFASHPDFVAISLQTPRGVVCLVSSLAFHEATTEIPRHVDIAIPRGTHANRIKYPPVKFYRFAPATWEAGIEIHEIEGHKVKIYSLAKTVADCFKFRNKTGVDVAREALKIAVMEKHIRPKEIMHYAKICRVDGLIKPLMETIL